MKNNFILNFNYFKFLFYFNILGYFKFIFYFNLINSNFFKFQTKKIRINFKFKNNNLNKNYLLNYLSLFFLKNKAISKNLNFNNYKNLINLIYNLNINKLNYLLFDSNYKNCYSLYYNMFNFKNLLVFKKYFFNNPTYFTHKNWIYFYNNFLINFKIFAVVIFNLNSYIKYIDVLLSLGVILFVLKDNYLFLDYDYNLFLKLDYLNSYFLIILLNNIFFISMNFNFYKNKILFINFFINFIN